MLVFMGFEKMNYGVFSESPKLFRTFCKNVVAPSLFLTKPVFRFKHVSMRNIQRDKATSLEMIWEKRFIFWIFRVGIYVYTYYVCNDNYFCIFFVCMIWFVVVRSMFSFLHRWFVDFICFFVIFYTLFPSFIVFSSSKSTEKPPRLFDT